MIFKRNSKGLLERQRASAPAQKYEAPRKPPVSAAQVQTASLIPAQAPKVHIKEAPTMTAPTQMTLTQEPSGSSPSGPSFVRAQTQTPEFSNEDSIEDLSIEQPETVLGEGVCFKGELSFKRYLCINGEFEGELTSNGKVKVGKTGVVRSNLRLTSAIIEGRIEGDIVVEDLLELRGTAQVYGNISARYLRVDDGVTLCGHIKINPQGLDLDEPILFGEEVKR